MSPTSEITGLFTRGQLATLTAHILQTISTNLPWSKWFSRLNFKMTKTNFELEIQNETIFKEYGRIFIFLDIFGNILAFYKALLILLISLRLIQHR